MMIRGTRKPGYTLPVQSQYKYKVGVLCMKHIQQMHNGDDMPVRFISEMTQEVSIKYGIR